MPLWGYVAVFANEGALFWSKMLLKKGSRAPGGLILRYPHACGRCGGRSMLAYVESMAKVCVEKVDG